MKKVTLIICQLLIAGYCFGQDIDKRALGVMQASFDKLAILKTIKYGMTFTDTMLRAPGPPRVEKTLVTGIIKKNAYWHLLFEDKTQWLFKADTLFKKSESKPNFLTYTTEWNPHEVSKYSIYNILGKQRPSMQDKNIAVLKFAQDTLMGNFYVITSLRTKIDYQTDEIKDVIHYDRYWIDKKTLLPVRRKMYGESLQNGKQSIDIYDFEISIDKVNQDFQAAKSFFDQIMAIEEINKPENLEVGVIAPNFNITNVNTNKLVSLNDLKGKVILLDFWYLSCMPCRILTPKIQKLYKKFAEKDVAVIGINIKDTATNEIVKFLERKMITFPQYYKSGNLVEAYKLYAYPTTMIIGKDGKIKLVEVGLGDETEKKLEQIIKHELLAPIL